MAKTAFGPIEYSVQTDKIYYSAQNDSVKRSTTGFGIRFAERLKIEKWFIFIP
jgi:hypothetical protein